MDYFELFWWFFVNIAIPVFAPIVFPLIGLLSSTHHDRAKLVAHKAVEDGQLFWLVIVLLSAACYELLEYQHLVPHGLTTQVAGLAILLFAIIGSASVGLVLVQAYTFTSTNAKAEGPSSADTGILLTSKWFMVIAIFGLFVTHVVVTAAKDEIKEAEHEEVVKLKEANEAQHEQVVKLMQQLACLKKQKQDCVDEKGE